MTKCKYAKCESCGNVGQVYGAGEHDIGGHQLSMAVKKQAFHANPTDGAIECMKCMSYDVSGVRWFDRVDFPGGYRSADGVYVFLF